jgi:hypothetical protein
VDQTLVMQRGVSLSDLEQGARTGGFDTKGSGFSKKQDKGNMVFWIIAGAVLLVIIGVIVFVLLGVK